ncbi:MAG: 2Fe-2S iron-sulfur cluster binding domain-containing protein [Bacillota bacterium]|jgi:CDP-4-dehydro-6-deoxyglucose reductase|nr:2Fe-2S iron-sulfur cluster binding domain-containing protein [Bacillota bacterium]MDP4156288.1 2Fe-2S iron-sulfur cluster binding domain-containing protein [Bacillota bacterium]
MFTVKVKDHPTNQPEFSCKDKQSVLDAARSQGIVIQYACKGGGCGLCKIKVEAGKFEIGKSSKAVLPDAERELNYALACKTYPKSNLEVRIQPS